MDNFVRYKYQDLHSLWTNIYESVTHSNVIIVCRGGERIFGHMALLSIQNRMFREIFETSDDDPVLVLMPDHNGAVVENVFRMLGEGSVNLDDAQEVVDVVDALHLLGFAPLVNSGLGIDGLSREEFSEWFLPSRDVVGCPAGGDLQSAKDPDLLDENLDRVSRDQFELDLTGTFRCNLCTFSSDRFGDVAGHYFNHLSCGICLFKYRKKSDQLEHFCGGETGAAAPGERGGRHVCGVCGKTYKTYGHYIAHHKTHGSGRAVATESEDVAARPSFEAGDDGWYHCSSCPYRCRQAGNLRVHWRIHSDEKPFSCNVCSSGTSFRSVSALYRHLRKHTGEESAGARRRSNKPAEFPNPTSEDDDIPKHRCAGCSKVFALKTRLKAHVEKFHPWLKTDKISEDCCLPCSLCGKKFPGEELLRAHERTQHVERTSGGGVMAGAEGIGMYGNLIYGTDENLIVTTTTEEEVFVSVAHRQASDRTGLPCISAEEMEEEEEAAGIAALGDAGGVVIGDFETITEEANFDVPSAATLATEEEDPAHPDVPSTATCRICSKRFSSKHTLRVHVHRSHVAERDVPCPEASCYKMFLTATEAKAHHRKVHTEEEKRVCPECGAVLKTMESYRRHVRIHSGNSYVCGICIKEFASKDYLEAHVEASHGEKRYGCHFCCPSFSTGEDLTGASKFAFSTATKLVRHVKQVHKKPDFSFKDIVIRPPAKPRTGRKKTN